MAATMELQGARQHSDGAGVKVKFIETQFVSSDAASFKSVVQRLTGKSSTMPPPPSVHRPRPRVPSGARAAGEQQGRPCVSGSEQLATVAPAATFEPHRVEEVNGLCDFADLFYATAGARRDAGSIASGFPY
ncbi:hypothetical protein QYE76_034132 [Lolium multiflorum]|jgi:hypothetical protein|uniref:VQ domain-containing protein n=1 Tax=Lolium multiflorum TaxID=4521 RepID=A0AAD8VKX6_LOLMU|nr:hypothetical protein QYE76_034132 [Lolium multiflorum]